MWEKPRYFWGNFELYRDKLWEAGREIYHIWKHEFWLDHWLPNWGMSNWCFITSLKIHFQGSHLKMVHTPSQESVVLGKHWAKLVVLVIFAARLRRRAWEHLRKSVCLFKIWRAESTVFSKVLFAIGKVLFFLFFFSLCRGINLGKYKHFSNPLLWDEDRIVAFPCSQAGSLYRGWNICYLS